MEKVKIFYRLSTWEVFKRKLLGKPIFIKEIYTAPIEYNYKDFKPGDKFCNICGAELTEYNSKYHYDNTTGELKNVIIGISCSHNYYRGSW